MPIKKQLSKKSAKPASRRATNATVRVVRADNAPNAYRLDARCRTFSKSIFNLMASQPVRNIGGRCCLL